MNTDLKAALNQNFPVGTCHAIQSETYGNILIIATGIVGNLILYDNFYPAAYIRPETSTAILNDEEPFPPNGNFHNLQKLIKQICKTVIECYSVDELIEYVDLNKDFGLS